MVDEVLRFLSKSKLQSPTRIPSKWTKRRFLHPSIPQPSIGEKWYTQNSKYLDQCQKIVIGKILLHNDRLHDLCLIVKHLNGEWKQRLSILSRKIEKIQLAFRFFLLPSRQTQSSRIWNNRNGQHSSWPHLIDDPPTDYWYKTNILLICRILCSSSISTMSFTSLNVNAYIDNVAVNLWWTQS